MPSTKILAGDCIQSLKQLPDASVNCCVTSPPYYGLRDYGYDGQIGLEESPDAFIKKLVEVFREVKRVLRDDGTCWVNLGDTYSATRWSSGGGQGINNHNDEHRSIQHPKNSGLPDKNLIGIPWKFAFSMQADGWFLRQDIIWHKPMTMPEPVKDRCVKAHEYIFLLSKKANYYFDYKSIQEPVKGKTIGANGKEYTMANKRDVWSVSPKRYKEAHFATYPPDLIKPCILAGCPEGGVVIDPFGGSGTTAEVAMQNGRNAILCELNPDYVKIIEKRLSQTDPLFNTQ
jgi:site-specific DNA-methyltransferase (adenine-specific)